MAMVDPAHFKGAWGGKVLPSPLPGYRENSQEGATLYVDENGNTWRVESYVPDGAVSFDESAWHWRATVSANNSYNEDPRSPSISGSESEYKAVLAIDEFARNWNAKHPSGGGGVLLLLVIAFLAFNERKR